MLNFTDLSSVGKVFLTNPYLMCTGPDKLTDSSSFLEEFSYLISLSHLQSLVFLILISLILIFLVCLVTTFSLTFSNSILKGAINFVNQFITFSVQVSGSSGSNGSSFDDRVYTSLLKWAGNHLKTLQREKILPKKADKQFEISTSNSKYETSDSDEDARQHADHEWVCQLDKTIGYGTNHIFYNNKWITFQRQVLNPKVTIDYKTQEMITLSTYFWNKSLLYKILEQAKPKAKKADEKTLAIYKACVQSECWTRLGGPKKKRPLNSLILDSRVIQDLLNDIKEFLSLEDWYVERGIPYRRGYLLYGPPGCGKSSIIKAIAGELEYDISVFSLGQKLTDDSMTELLNSAPSKSIILLEDIDAAFKSREDEGASARETNLAFEGCSQSSLTFRGLLNALDGVASADDGQLVFMTTNYPEKLDPALVRPGRVDLKICINYPEDSQIEGMFKKFYPTFGDNEDMRIMFVKAIRSVDLKISMAMLQGLMLVYRNNPQEAIDNVKEHFEKQFSNTNLRSDNSRGLYC